MSHIVFDAFGTLFKTTLPANEIGLDHEMTQRILGQYRRQLLQSTWLYTLAQEFIPFDVLSKQALEVAFQRENIALNHQGFNILLGMYENPVVFEGVFEILEQLSARGHRIYMLSNGTIRMLTRAAKSCGLTHLIHQIISAEQVRVYKPHADIYELGLASIGTSKNQITFVSSNDWDVFGASTFGFRPIWIDRNNQKQFPYQTSAPITRAENFTDLPDLIQDSHQK